MSSCCFEQIIPRKTSLLPVRGGGVCIAAKVTSCLSNLLPLCIYVFFGKSTPAVLYGQDGIDSGNFDEEWVAQECLRQ